MKWPFKIVVIAALVTTNIYCNPDNDVLDLHPVVTTVAGSTEGFADGIGTAAQFNHPSAICADPQGNIYIADKENHRIRKITPAGVVSTLAGSTAGYNDGNVATAKFYDPTGITIDAAGNLYVADMTNHRIRKITAAGVVSTLAGSTPGLAEGQGAAAKFWFPVGICIDPSGNLFVADQANCRIRKITPAGLVSTFSGGGAGQQDGSPAAARFGYPTGICIDRQGSFYVTDYENNRIRKISPAGDVSTLAGSSRGFSEGMGTAAKFDRPFGLCSDAQGNIYIADMWNARLRKITPAGVVSTFAGSAPGQVDGNLSDALFGGIAGVCINAEGDFYLVELNAVIRKIDLP